MSSTQSASAAISDTPAKRRPKTAVIPAAGFGTRLRPLTNAIPKEMLPVGGKVALERIVEEQRGAGITDIVFVLSPPKQALIRGYFGEGANGVTYRYAIQAEMRGLGDALLKAEPFLDTEYPIVVALGDAVFEEPIVGGLTRRLCDALIDSDAAVGLAVQKVARERLSRYGVVRPAENASLSGTVIAIADIVEKPAPEEAPSEYAAAARYVAWPSIFEVLRATPPGKDGEIQFTDALRAQMQNGLTGIAVPLQPGEVRHDIGGLDSYYRAFVAFALKDPDFGPGLRALLKDQL
jgi:UTP--glucose-1-phosphate uridylyltransferase